MACTSRGQCVLDPFTGSGTTGIAANLLGRNFVGGDLDVKYLTVARNRRIEMDRNREVWLSKLQDVKAVN